MDYVLQSERSEISCLHIMKRLARNNCEVGCTYQKSLWRYDRVGMYLFAKQQSALIGCVGSIPAASAIFYRTDCFLLLDGKLTQSVKVIT